MKISVIMPVYNCEDYLEAAVASVLSQDTVEIELIAVDDLSTDSSRDILKRLAESDSRIKAYYNDKNLGVAEVRNIALSYATGEYLAFCDSDDTVPVGAYAALSSAAQGVDVAIGSFKDVNDKGDMDRLCTVSSDDKRSLFKSLFSVSCLWTKLIRRSFVLEHGLKFDTSMSIGEDVVFLAHLAVCSPTYNVTDALVYHHFHHEMAKSKSLTHRYDIATFRKHIECRERLLSICSDIAESRDFVYLNFSAYLTNLLPFVDLKDREDAFLMYKEHLLSYDFQNKPLLFKALVGVPYDKFVEADAEAYFELKYDMLARDVVLAEFESGRIGMRWIIRYFTKWLKFKITKSYK